MTETSNNGTKVHRSSTDIQSVTIKSLLTLKEVAGLLRLSPQTVYKMLDRGSIPAVKVGNQWRFEPDRIRAWLTDQDSNTARESIS